MAQNEVFKVAALVPPARSVEESVCFDHLKSIIPQNSEIVKLKEENERLKASIKALEERLEELIKKISGN